MDIKQLVKYCHKCNTTSTIEWRRDSFGNALCNACGIKYHKERRLNEEKEAQELREKAIHSLHLRSFINHNRIHGPITQPLLFKPDYCDPTKSPIIYIIKYELDGGIKIFTTN